jgi:hypothetical protein
LVTAADAAGPLHEEVSTGEALQSASAEETADASEKLIRIVKDKTQMSAEIELEHRGDMHNDVLRKKLDAFSQKFLVPTPSSWEPGVGVGEWTTPRRGHGGMIQAGGFLNVMSRRWCRCGAHPLPIFTPCGVISIILIGAS